MELLYFIDRTLTERIQKASIFVGKRLGLLISGVIHLACILMIYLYVPVLYFYFQISFLEILLGVVVLFIELIATIILMLLIGITLVAFHILIDPEEAFRTEKEYSSGYTAWADSGTCIILFILFLTIDSQMISYVSLFVFFAQFGQTIKEFESRKKGNSRRRDNKMTSEVLDKLLERCRSWLPQPQPVPITVNH